VGSDPRGEEVERERERMETKGGENNGHWRWLKMFSNTTPAGEVVGIAEICCKSARCRLPSQNCGCGLCIDIRIDTTCREGPVACMKIRWF